MTEPKSSAQAKEVWITGIGIVSSLGEGLDAHWEALNAERRINVDDKRFAPYIVHPLAPVSIRRADPEKGRSAPDGSLAAHRHLCRRAGAGIRPASKATRKSSAGWT